MEPQNVMKMLEEMGTEQNRKIYRRHGDVDPLFGVSYANLKELAREIKKDQVLAGSLWVTDNHDARILATMIADPGRIDPGTALEWAGSVKNHMQSDALSALIAGTAFWKDVMEKMVPSELEYVKACGYSVLSSALKDKREISEEDLKGILSRIEEEIHSSPNRARYSMNGAVISIGVFRPELADIAMDTGGRIGKVEVDHGQTSCGTPDISGYIRKTRGRSGKAKGK